MFGATSHLPASIFFPMTENKTSLELDILKGSFAYRMKQSRAGNELLAKAVGIKGSYKPTIIDATAGLGRDSLILAYLGCQVLMIERSGKVFEMLEKTLEKIADDPVLHQKLQLKLIHADAIHYLSQMNSAEYPDVIYLDPMFPERRKTALVKKEMRLLREIVGEDPDAPTLLTIALEHVKKRVVVKRPRLAPVLGDLVPSFVIKGKAQRFDVYQPNP